jgi:hypothetical protein
LTNKEHSQSPATLLPWHKFGGVGKAVVDGGVRQVVVEVLDGALPGDDGLHKEAKDGHQREAAALDLLHLELGKGVGVVGQAQWVEGAAGVQVVIGVDEVGAVDAEGLCLAQEDDLRSSRTLLQIWFSGLLCCLGQENKHC